MYLRLINALTALLLLFVASGAALQVHERLEHRDALGAVTSVAVTSAIDGNKLPSSTDAIAPARPLRSRSHDDCPTCDQLLHLAVVAAIVLFVFGLFARAITHRPAVIPRPDLVALASPRSSRGPPLFA